MKNKIILFWMLLLSGISLAQIGINSKDPLATLDINAKNPTGITTAVDGMLIPRVDRQKAQSMTGIPISTLIYVNNITTGTQAGITANMDEPGFYYFDGNVWVKLRDPYNLGPIVDDWKALGNADTNPATNFLGTTDDQGLAIRTNNVIRALIENTGILRLGDIANASVNRSAVSIANANTTAAEQPGVLSVIDNRLSTAVNESPPSADIFNRRGGPASDLLSIGHNSDNNASNYAPRSIALYNVNATNNGQIGQIAWIATPGKATRSSQTAASISDYIRDKTNNYAGLSFSTRGASGFGSRMVINPIGYVGIGTTTPTSLLDLGATFGSNINDVAGKKLAVYNNVPGTDFYGLGISPGTLQFHAASTTDEVPGMILNGNGNVGIGTATPANNVILDLSATNKAFLPPRLTTAQRDALNPKQAGMMVYNVTTNCLEFWNSNSWVSTCAVVAPPAGAITGINCAGAVRNGTLVANAPASGVSASIPYSGGNGGSHPGQEVNSTGTITGLTATLQPGNFLNGAGNLQYTISGTPSASGTATFAINIGGQSCSLTMPVSPPAAAVATLGCGSPNNIGSLVAGVAASGVSSIISYTGGNGGTYPMQTVNSTGVQGLTATLAGSNLLVGSGNLTFNITGTPSSSGTAFFQITVGGITCTFQRPVTAPLGSATINCGGATLSGTLKNNNAASGVTLSVPYTGGNGGTYSAQPIQSTGVLGLTATPIGSNFNVGSGTLVFNITGTPQGEGTASFNVNIVGGAPCPANVTVNELQTGDLTCPGPTAGRYPYPYVVTKYIQCITVGGVLYAYPYTCPSGTQFNNTLKQCVAP